MQMKTADLLSAVFSIEFRHAWTGMMGNMEERPVR